jgi:hypothetical protein
MFRFAPEYHHVKDREPDGHLTIESTCRLIHSPSGTLVATGSGICSTHESKYAYRKQNRMCPRCEKEAIRKDTKPKNEGGGGYYCWRKLDGCGAQFKTPADIALIEEQVVGRVPNEDLADQWNTIIKMADKRSLIAALLNGTAASDIFNQDLEEIRENLESRAPAPQAAPAAPIEPQGDLASDAQRKMLWKAVKAKMGEGQGRYWIEREMRELGCTRDTMTVDQLKMLVEQVAVWEKPTPVSRGDDGPSIADQDVLAGIDNDQMSDKDIEF